MMFMGSPAITHLMDENFQYTFVRDGGLANQKSCFGLQHGVGGREIISSFLLFRRVSLQSSLERPRIRIQINGKVIIFSLPRDNIIYGC